MAKEEVLELLVVVVVEVEVEAQVVVQRKMDGEVQGQMEVVKEVRVVI